MRAKEFMQKVYDAGAELQLLENKKASYLELATGAGSGLSSVPTTRTKEGSRVENAAVRIADLTTGLDEQAGVYIELIKQAEALINKIPQIKYREVLSYRYLCRYSWKTIQEKMGYTDSSSVYHAHGFALSALQRLM